MAPGRGSSPSSAGLVRLPERLDALDQRLAEAAAALHDAREEFDARR